MALLSITAGTGADSQSSTSSSDESTSSPADMSTSSPSSLSSPSASVSLSESGESSSSTASKSASSASAASIVAREPTRSILAPELPPLDRGSLGLDGGVGAFLVVGTGGALTFFGLEGFAFILG